MCLLGRRHSWDMCAVPVPAPSIVIFWEARQAAQGVCLVESRGGRVLKRLPVAPGGPQPVGGGKLDLGSAGGCEGGRVVLGHRCAPQRRLNLLPWYHEQVSRSDTGLIVSNTLR